MILSSLLGHCNTSECIRISDKGVALGKGVCSRLGLKDGDFVGVFSDNERKGDLYLCPAPPASGYALHKRGKQYHLYSRDLARRLLQEANVNTGNALFKVGEAIDYGGVVALPIISRINYANH